MDFQDFLENCLRFVALWWGMKDGPSAKVNDEFAATASVDYLMQLRAERLISLETLAMLMKRAGVLPDDFNYTDETARLARETTESINAGPMFTSSLTRMLQVGTQKEQ